MWLIVLTMGCLSFVDGKTEQGRLNCQLLEACGELEKLGYDSVDACFEVSDAQPYDRMSCEDYDAAAMQECLDGWAAAVEAKDCAPEVAACGEVCSS